jgi:hypothetical protein
VPIKPKDGAFASAVACDFERMLIEERRLVASLPERGRHFRRSDPCNSNDVFQDFVMDCGIEG